MKKVCLLLTFSINCLLLSAQTIGEKLEKALRELEKDSQMEAALVSLFVMDSDNGTVVYEKNSRYGMAPASTQKLFTAAAILEMLGEKFSYKTTVSLYEQGNNAVKSGIVGISGSGDPSLGSWRYTGTKKDFLLQTWAKALIKARPGLNLKMIYVNELLPGDRQTIPDGYIWQDIGNYYGAGTSLLNWNENQYDIVFRSGVTGKPATVISLDTTQKQLKYHFSVFSGAAGSGDNTYIYAAPFAKEAIVSGTIPPNQRSFTISGSMPDPAYTVALSLQNHLVLSGGTIDPALKIESPRASVTMEATGPVTTAEASSTENDYTSLISSASPVTSIEYRSPTLDSLVFWFLRKSINLYGEAFVKTIANERKDGYDLGKGLDHVTEFWVDKGIRKSEISLIDGSGLSPQNRVTTRALAQVLKYSAGRNWFPAFLDALPTYNGMKMKSGSINGSRAFAGYHKSAKGKKYTFAIMINNYNGSSAEVVKKMYAVLDLLK
jgi:D-alanyl-D-alanine carboxypeptidase/D-alanyl-D-alanine-endopeptidase (penicillin-binding protein 4)